MSQCPVCKKELPAPLPPFCDRCGWDLKNDLTLMVSISDIPGSVVEEYTQRLATARRNWSEKAAMAEKLRELERRLDESENRKKVEKIKIDEQLKEAATKKHKKKKAVANWIEPVTGMKFVFVPGGTFVMGDVFGDGYDDEKPVHEVALDDFYIGKFPVTQGQWKKVLGNNPSEFQKGVDYPVENVSWHDAIDFTEKLQTMDGNDFTYDLPTEAQWEYAARSGGKKERYAGGEHVDMLAWYKGNSDKTKHPVGRKKPNGLGLYDMSGNVREWCRDWYGGYPSGYDRNPAGPTDGAGRVNRGGSWITDAGYCRSAYRNRSTPDARIQDLGFRVLAVRR